MVVGWIGITRCRSTQATVEVTTSAHRLDYLNRELFHTTGMSWGPHHIRRDKKTKQIVSEPHACKNDERSIELSDQILERISAKSEKGYPPGTILIVNCQATGLILDDEWDRAVERVKSARLHLGFRETFLIEQIGNYTATLWGNHVPIRHRAKRPS